MKEGKPSAAEAAGGHLDPQHSGKHEGPDGMGHLGDLPVLVVNNDGKATDPVMAPVQRRLPPIGGLDLSPIAVTIGLILLQMLLLPPLKLLTGSPF